MTRNHGPPLRKKWSMITVFNPKYIHIMLKNGTYKTEGLFSELSTPLDKIDGINLKIKYFGLSL